MEYENSAEYKRLKELENILDQNCETYENDCATCPYNEECKEYFELSMILR